jgi:AcrR family transcriptional regulator
LARPRDAGIDRAIIAACLELLDEVGRAGLSRDQIARRAGVSLPAVNRRFASVDDILLEVVSTPIYVQKELPETEDLRSYLTSVLNRAVDTLDRVPIRRPTAEILAAAAGSDQIANVFAATLAQVQAETVRRIDVAREAGELRPDSDAQLLLDLLNGALYYRLLWRGEKMNRSDVVLLVDSVLRAAAAKGP